MSKTHLRVESRWIDRPEELDVACGAWRSFLYIPQKGDLLSSEDPRDVSCMKCVATRPFRDATARLKGKDPRDAR